MNSNSESSKEPLEELRELLRGQPAKGIEIKTAEYGSGIPPSFAICKRCNNDIWDMGFAGSIIVMICSSCHASYPFAMRQFGNDIRSD